MANELSLGCDCLGQIHYMVSVSSIWLLSFVLSILIFSLAASSHMTAARLFSRMPFASTKKITVFSGNIRIIGPMVGVILQGGEGW